MMIELTDKLFDDTISQGIVLIDWWAAWCGPCRAFAPVFERVAAGHPDIVFAKVDTEAQPELASGAGIYSIPTLMVFRDGILVFEHPGALTAAALEKLVAQVRALDMDDVRRRIADPARSAG